MSTKLVSCTKRVSNPYLFNPFDLAIRLCSARQPLFSRTRVSHKYVALPSLKNRSKLKSQSQFGGFMYPK